MFAAIVEVLSMVVLPMVLGKTIEDRLHWIKPYLREVWFVIFLIYTMVVLSRPGSESYMTPAKQGFGSAYPIGSYVLVGILGAVLFVCYWWFLGVLLPPKTDASSLQNAQTNPPLAPTQSTSGNQSPIISGGSGITINYNNTDPKLKSKLDEIANLLKEQRSAEVVTPAKLLEKYPLGYVIFDISYRNEAFPYRDETAQRYTFDWSAVKYTPYDDNRIAVTFPTIRRKDGGFISQGDILIVPKKVGPIRAGFFKGADVQILGEILAITDKGIVFLMGMQTPKP